MLDETRGVCKETGKLCVRTVVLGRIWFEGGGGREMVSRDIGCATLWWTLAVEIRDREFSDRASSSELTTSSSLK